MYLHRYICVYIYRNHNARARALCFHQQLVGPHGNAAIDCTGGGGGGPGCACVRAVRNAANADGFARAPGTMAGGAGLNVAAGGNVVALVGSGGKDWKGIHHDPADNPDIDISIYI